MKARLPFSKPAILSMNVMIDGARRWEQILCAFFASLRFHWSHSNRREAKNAERTRIDSVPFARTAVSTRMLLVLCSLALSLQPLAVPTCHAQWMQQTIQLKPGWNAVFLEAHPEPEECDLLFAGLPVESVWDFNPSVDSPQFVQDPSALIPGAPGWLTWFPPSHPLASQSTLSILRDGRPYLVKLADNAQPINWVVTGKPSLRRITWQSGGVNFVGFHVGATGPTFQNLFAGEDGLTNQPVSFLDLAGVWRQVANLSATRATAGQAYWIRCILPAQRGGTIQVDPGSLQGLSFLDSATEQSLRIRNTSAGVRNISVRLLGSASPPAGQPPLAGPVPLEYWRADFATTNFQWTAFA